MTDKCEFIMDSYHDQSCVLYYMIMSPYQINHQKRCGFKYKSLNKSLLPAAHCCIYYVFHLPLSAKPVSTSFGSSEGWKLHFKLLDNNFFFFFGGGGCPHNPQRKQTLYEQWPITNTIGSHLWKKLLKSQRYIQVTEIERVRHTDQISSFHFPDLSHEV